jgi:N-acetylmuramic acid 6-phosphate etherase
MSDTSRKRSEDFLRISAQFKLGALVTESSHPLTATLSEAARGDISSGLDQLFDVDSDIIKKYRDFVESGRAGNIQQTVLNAVRNGGKIFFTGCGSTGRLSIHLAASTRAGIKKLAFHQGTRGPRLQRDGGGRLRTHQSRRRLRGFH